MKRLALALVFLFGFAPPVWADFQAGVDAYNRGDYATALREMRLLAKQGTAEAQFNLGLLYDRGQGVPQDYAEAKKWYREAAEQGLAEAQYNLGLMYYKGQGVAQDYAEAVNWTRKAAERGLADAQFNLGLMYHQGRGVSQSYTEALNWYRKAAEQKLVSAWGALGKMYHLGEGVVQDYAKAVNWFQRAAEHGDAYSQMKLGVMYFEGAGVPQDYVQAHKWSNLAASRFPPGKNRDLAVPLRDIVAAKMTAAQIAEAQRLAREWKPKTQAASKLNLLLEAERRGTLPTKKKDLLDEARRRGLIPGNQTTPPTASSETVKSIQVLLAELGYKPGLTDGILGAQTRSTIEAYQRDQGLPVTGEASRKLKELLLWHVISKEQEGEKPKKLELSN